MQELLRRVMVGEVEVLTEYTPEQLGSELDQWGWNSFHFLAQLRKKEILKFKGAYQIRNKKGQTAIDVLLKGLTITRPMVYEYFPWYIPTTTEETVEESIKAIHEISNAEHFFHSF